MIVFLIIYFVYVVIGYFLFGKIFIFYCLFFVVFGSLMNFIIGKNYFDILWGLGGVFFGELYYLIYIFIVILIMIFMFVVILNLSIFVVKKEF